MLSWAMGPSSRPECSWYFEAERVPTLPKHNCSFVPPLILDKDSEGRDPNWLHRDAQKCSMPNKAGFQESHIQKYLQNY